MKKLITYSLVTLLVLVLCGLVWVHVYLNEDRLGEYGGQLLGDDFELTIESADLSLFFRNLNLEGVDVQFRRDDDWHKILAAPGIDIQGIGLRSLYHGDIDIAALVVTSPEADLSMMRSGPDERVREQSVPSIRIGLVQVEDGKLALATEQFQGELTGLGLSVSDFLSDQMDSFPDKNQEFSLSIREGDFLTPDQRYGLVFEDLQINDTMSSLNLGRLEVGSPLDSDEFFEISGYRTELVELIALDLSVAGLNIRDLIHRRGFTGGLFGISSMDLHVSLDRAYEPDPDKNRMPMPQSILMDLPFELRLDSVDVKEANIRYSEYPEHGGEAGTLRFESVEAAFSSISNIEFEPVDISVAALVQGTGDLGVQIKLGIRGEDPYTEVSGTLAEFDPVVLSPLLSRLERIEFNSGIVRNLDFDYILEMSGASGTTSASWEQIGISTTGSEEQGVWGRFSDYVTNTVVLRSSGNNRKGEIDQERDPDRSFFHYMWASLRSGLLDMIRRI